MSNRLLDRQTKLLEFLTSGAVIFDDPGDVLGDYGLGGIDCGLLRLEARFSHEKRMEKIVAVFPRTFEMLKEHVDGMISEFVQDYPPRDISRLENARQFYDFLYASHQRVAALPRYLCDVAACELACAQVCANDVVFRTRHRENSSGNAIRRDPGAALLRCRYDVRAIFEGGAAIDPLERETLLGVSIPVGADQPRIFEMLPAVFDLLSAMDEWIDLTAVAATPELKALVHDLSAARLIEVHA